MRRLDNKVAGITGRSIEFSGARRDFVKTVGIVAGGSLLPSSFTRVQAAGKEASHGDGPSQAQTSGIKVVTYDADVADPTARQWFVNQATFTEAGAALVDVVAEQAGTSALRRCEHGSRCVQPELLDHHHEGADEGEVPEDAAG